MLINIIGKKLARKMIWFYLLSSGFIFIFHNWKPLNEFLFQNIWIFFTPAMLLGGWEMLVLAYWIKKYWN